MTSELRRILVIDDSEEIREFLQLVLERAGYRVQVAADGREGLEAVRELHPHLIITDISMPVMDGFEFLVRLRSDFPPPLPPVIVCSGFDGTAEEALRLGAVQFVAKPIEPDSLLVVVQQTLRGQPTGPSDAQRERAAVAMARTRAAAAAARMHATLKEQAPSFQRSVPLFAQWVADYFATAPAGVVLVDGGNVRVAAVSQDSFVAAGTLLPAQLLFATGLLAAGTSFVMPASFDRFRGPYVETLGLEFVVAVPLVFEGVPIGAVGLFDREGHPFGAEDLAILEGIGRNSSRALRADFPIASNLGFLPSPLFDLALGCELAALHRERGGIELLLVEMEEAAMRPELALEIVRQGGARLALCRREPGTLAIYKRDVNAAAAREAMASALAMLRSAGAVRATGWVSVADTGLAPMPSEILLRLVELALEQSRSSGAGQIERTLIEHAQWSDTSPLSPASIDS